jgi:2-phosphosulfolactate phosphatase
MDGRISVVPAGERWPDGSLRPALEDLIGAGAIVHYLGEGRALSPEAEVAVAAFRWAGGSLRTILSDAVSGRELIEKGFPQDVEMASILNCSNTVPVLKDADYRHWPGS